MRRSLWWLPLLAVAVMLAWWLARSPATTDAASPAPAPAASSSGPSLPASRDARLPDQAWQTIALIQRGGPFPHRQDGSVFGNREDRLPRMPRGYYREYTVDTPGLAHRGARRIVTGGRPPVVWYYTDDHYDSFRRIEVQP